MKRKQAIEDLALFGGEPLFSEPLYVGRPNLTGRDRFLRRVEEALDRKWLTNAGPFVREFEERLGEYLGVRHAIAMCNGTVALEITARALGFKGEVIVPSMTFIATAHALQWQEITPVFCDVDPETHTIDPAKVEALITPRTTGIIGVHLWGQACAIEELEEIARRHHLGLIFDAAHAFASSHHGHRIGRFGDAEVFSFHATKFLNTLEGGAVATDDDDLAEKIRLMKNFGFSGFDNVIYIGTNGKMNELSAAMGLTLLESLDELLAIHQENYRQYFETLAGIDGVRMLEFHDPDETNAQYIVLEWDNDRSLLHRDEIIRLLHAENIIARRYFYPGCHRMEPYKSYYPHAGLLLPQTEEILDRVICLPTGTSIGADDIERIGMLMRFYTENAREIHGRVTEEMTAI